MRPHDRNEDQDREISRVVVRGKDARDKSGVEMILMRYADRCELYVPALSHTVRLDAYAVVALANALAPGGVAEVVVGLRAQTGEWTVISPGNSGRELSEKSTLGLLSYFQAAQTRLARFGFTPPTHAPRRTA